MAAFQSSIVLGDAPASEMFRRGPANEYSSRFHGKANAVVHMRGGVGPQARHQDSEIQGQRIDSPPVSARGCAGPHASQQQSTLLNQRHVSVSPPIGRGGAGPTATNQTSNFGYMFSSTPGSASLPTTPRGPLPLHMQSSMMGQRTSVVMPNARGGVGQQPEQQVSHAVVGSAAGAAPPAPPQGRHLPHMKAAAMRQYSDGAAPPRTVNAPHMQSAAMGQRVDVATPRRVAGAGPEAAMQQSAMMGQRVSVVVPSGVAGAGPEAAMQQSAMMGQRVSVVVPSGVAGAGPEA
eukprot:CAMPEP_0117478486 /NCGR_PEP_ID=MMETSP0784-20121206/11377_1 /TAXON_ID=39447 /ORGANISM="" /LENGTH=290 /DNA_ID=CAMNT_0005272849 /DNA_START=50 /DNA_END=919 /DNA_ORIENTATION=-